MEPGITSSHENLLKDRYGATYLRQKMAPKPFYWTSTLASEADVPPLPRPPSALSAPLRPCNLIRALPH